VYTVDDSSGVCIECTCPAPPPQDLALQMHFNQGTESKSTASTAENRNSTPAKKSSTPSVEAPLIPWEEMDVGAVVKIKGRPNTFRDVKQVDIIKVEIMRSTEQEVRCWNEVLAFRKEVLRVPWVVSQEAEAKFRSRAEREKQYKNRPKKHGKSKAGKNGDVGREKGKDRNVESRRKDGGSDSNRKKGDEHVQKEREKERQEGLKPDNKANYLSLAVRGQLAGKYDALGI
jgi:hypothetical protein